MNALVPHRHAASAVVEPAPERCIARAWSGGPLPLGLDGCFALRGGDALAPGRLPLELALDWAPELQRLAVSSCISQSLGGHDWFAMPPAALVGPVGTGRTLMARRLARCAGVPFATIDVAGPAGSLRLQREGAPPDVPPVSDIVVALATTRCANPVVLVTGVDKASDATVRLLQQLTDPASSSRWSERSLGATIDLGRMTWLVQTSAPTGLPQGLSHLVRVPVRVAGRQDRDLRALTILSELIGDAGVDPPSLGEKASIVLEEIRAAADPSAAAGHAAGLAAWNGMGRSLR